jgi:hypothetical protein
MRGFFKADSPYSQLSAGDNARAPLKLQTAR